MLVGRAEPGVTVPSSHRTDVVSVVDTYQYEDPQDIFSREPFILRVSAPHSSEQRGVGDGSSVCMRMGEQAPVPLHTEAEEFVMVPLHSAPHDAVAEIDALYDVYLAVVNKWGTDVSAPAAPSPPWPRLLSGEEGMATKLGSGPGSGGG